ncbi:MAG: DUF6524 family protein [Pseudomonadota bacterium]
MGGFGFLLRIALAIGLVMVTYNPSGTSYFDWVQSGFETDTAVKALAGVVLVILYVICLRATLRSIGFIGAGLVIALLAAIIWVLVDYGYLNVEEPGLMQWLILLCIGIVLGIGLSWSHVRRALTGQRDMDDVDE